MTDELVSKHDQEDIRSPFERAVGMPIAVKREEIRKREESRKLEEAKRRKSQRR